MKILVALDEMSYSRRILKDIARLAKNTLADVVFMGVQENHLEPSPDLQRSLLKYHQDVCSFFSSDELPYADFSNEEWQKKGEGKWMISTKGLKKFTLLIKSGTVAKQIVSAAGELESDLIVLGCSSEFGCEWDGEMNVPLRIAEDAPCSVLVIKKSRHSNQIVSILDQSEVKQEAMEMINQLVTLNDAGLKIVGVQEAKDDKNDQIEQQMVQLLKYYNERKINTWVKVIDSNRVTEYVTEISKQAVIALWMGGNQSLIKRLFFQSMVDKLLNNSESSVFILR